MFSSLKGLPRCSGLLQSWALREDEVFSFQEPCSLTAMAEQSCISLGRGGEHRRLDGIPKAAAGKGAVQGAWKSAPPRISVPVFHLIDKVLFNPGPS